MSGSLLCGGGLGQHGVAVNVIEADSHAASRREVDQASRNAGGQGLPLFVVADVPLSAAKPLGHGLLGHAKTLADGFEVVHGLNNSGASAFVNIGAISHA